MKILESNNNSKFETALSIAKKYGYKLDDIYNKPDNYTLANIASTIKQEGNNVSGSIPDKIDNFLQDVAQMTNVISYNDIIKFGKKLSQSEQYRKYALGGIEHLIEKWGEALLYEDELMMDDIAYRVLNLIKL